MAEVVNLNKARKDRARAEEKMRADQNAVKFGRTKVQRAIEATAREKAKQALDQAKRDEP
ncbi:hypothetical protein BVG79_01358 [Ketogulonicigenium robustum]|uniref:Uncharacterized protein n=1 Tax=Ketogulonicigenium robustum TaxID=92947 RepID=A0A1W6NZR6_9RHOB|nr:DUF4169 family protein [Ketogulonicigenium robustum]ARO14704.1 hypothetical protein BVG79_01358 [Ketogulonicigenium robustum]